MKLLKRKGFVIRSKFEVRLEPERKQNIERVLTDASQNRWQLAVVILDTTIDQVYDYVKQLGNQQLGLRTQCIDMNALKKSRNNFSMCKDNLRKVFIWICSFV